MSEFHGHGDMASNSQRPECSDYSDENKKILYTEDGIPVTTLFLPSLNKEVAHQYIYEHFSSFGTVDKVRIEGKARNWFIFVTFTQFESAARAIDTQIHTIAGHHALVEIAKSEHQVAIEMTNGTGTTLLDLNDDCLNEMFSLKTISMSDLCSVARTSLRLKHTANEIFKRNQKKCRFKSLVSKPLEARRLITTFSSLIADVRFGGSQFAAEEWTNLLTLLARCSINSLKYLRIDKVFIHISTLSEWKKQFNELKNLEITKETLPKPQELDILGEMTYPKLRKLKYGNCNFFTVQNFMPRHQNLTSLSLSSCRSRTLPIIAEYCKDLQILMLSFFYPDADIEDALKILLVLGHLKILYIRCDSRMFITNFIRELDSMKSLELLRLQNVYFNSEFLPALSQLKKIRVLRLINCHDLVSNFDLIGEMKQLTELSIETKENVEINGLLLIERLINLKTLTLLVETFKVDKQMYSRIVDVVNGRPERSQQSLEIKCLAGGEDDFSIHRTVKLNRVAAQ